MVIGRILPNLPNKLNSAFDYFQLLNIFKKSIDEGLERGIMRVHPKDGKERISSLTKETQSKKHRQCVCGYLCESQTSVLIYQGRHQVSEIEKD